MLSALYRRSGSLLATLSDAYSFGTRATGTFEQCPTADRAQHSTVKLPGTAEYDWLSQRYSYLDLCAVLDHEAQLKLYLASRLSETECDLRTAVEEKRDLQNRVDRLEIDLQAVTVEKEEVEWQLGVARDHAEAGGKTIGSNRFRMNELLRETGKVIPKLSMQKDQSELARAASPPLPASHGCSSASDPSFPTTSQEATELKTTGSAPTTRYEVAAEAPEIGILSTRPEEQRSNTSDAAPGVDTSSQGDEEPVSFDDAARVGAEAQEEASEARVQGTKPVPEQQAVSPQPEPNEEEDAEPSIEGIAESASEMGRAGESSEDGVSGALTETSTLSSASPDAYTQDNTAVALPQSSEATLPYGNGVAQDEQPGTVSVETPTAPYEPMQQSPTLVDEECSLTLSPPASDPSSTTGDAGQLPSEQSSAPVQIYTYPEPLRSPSPDPMQLCDEAEDAGFAAELDAAPETPLESTGEELDHSGGSMDIVEESSSTGREQSPSTTTQVPSVTETEMVDADEELSETERHVTRSRNGDAETQQDEGMEDAPSEAVGSSTSDSDDHDMDDPYLTGAVSQTPTFNPSSEAVAPMSTPQERSPATFVPSAAPSAAPSTTRNEAQSTVPNTIDAAAIDALHQSMINRPKARARGVKRPPGVTSGVVDKRSSPLPKTGNSDVSDEQERPPAGSAPSAAPSTNSNETPSTVPKIFDVSAIEALIPSIPVYGRPIAQPRGVKRPPGMTSGVVDKQSSPIPKTDADLDEGNTGPIAPGTGSASGNSSQERETEAQVDLEAEMEQSADGVADGVDTDQQTVQCRRCEWTGSDYLLELDDSALCPQCKMELAYSESMSSSDKSIKQDPGLTIVEDTPAGDEPAVGKAKGRSGTSKRCTNLEPTVEKDTPVSDEPAVGKHGGSPAIHGRCTDPMSNGCEETYEVFDGMCNSCRVFQSFL